MQGSGADLVKIAQRDLARRLPEFEQVLQVHDEVVGEFTGSKKQALEVAKEVKRIMEESGRELTVPLLCEPKVAQHWREGKG
jgi:DNA polymerase I-like protein with 3'-5' exonuclease and polymerase domains